MRTTSRDEPDVHVCTVLPATIDTPLFQHAGNYTGRAVKAMPPVYPAYKAAAAIVELTEHPRREVLVGTSARMLVRQHALAPGATEKMMAKMVDRQHLSDEPAEATPGNVVEPMPEWTSVSGNWAGADEKRSNAARNAAAVLAVPAGLYLWRRLRSRSRQHR